MSSRSPNLYHDYFNSLTLSNASKPLLNSRAISKFRLRKQFLSSLVLVLHKKAFSGRSRALTGKKCTKICDARAELLFCLFNLLLLWRSRCRRRRGILKTPHQAPWFFKCAHHYLFTWLVSYFRKCPNSSFYKWHNHHFFIWRLSSGIQSRFSLFSLLTPCRHVLCQLSYNHSLFCYSCSNVDLVGIEIPQDSDLLYSQCSVGLVFIPFLYRYHAHPYNLPGVSFPLLGTLRNRGDDGNGTSENNRFNEQNNNSPRASRFFVHFFAFTAQLRRGMTKF